MAFNNGNKRTVTCIAAGFVLLGAVNVFYLNAQYLFDPLGKAGRFHQRYNNNPELIGEISIDCGNDLVAIHANAYIEHADKVWSPMNPSPNEIEVHRNYVQSQFFNQNLKCTRETDELCDVASRRMVADFEPTTGLAIALLNEEQCKKTTDSSYMEILTSVLSGALNADVKTIYVFSNHETKWACESAIRVALGIYIENTNVALEWIDVNIDSVWIRDYSPAIVKVLGQSVQTLDLVTPEYGMLHANGSLRSNDAEFGTCYAKGVKSMFSASATLSRLEVEVEGGNILTDGRGLCLTSDLTIVINAQRLRSSVCSQSDGTIELSSLRAAEQVVRERFLKLLGCKLLVLRSLRDYTTGHVDMYISFASSDHMVFGQYSPEQDAVNAMIMSENNNLLRQYFANVTILRMPSNCPFFGLVVPPTCDGVSGRDRIWRTYSNVVILNGQVLIPTFEEDQTYETSAIETWEGIMGLGNVHKVKGTDILAHAQGNLHCITREIHL